MQDVCAIALFCDDIREELGGQYSLMGVVSDNLAVPSVPGVIAKFAIHVRINLSVEAEPREFQTFLNNPDGERILISTISRELVASSLLEAKEHGNPIVGLYSHMIASPFPIKSLGRYWIELVWDKNSLFVGSMNIMLNGQGGNAPV